MKIQKGDIGDTANHSGYILSIQWVLMMGVYKTYVVMV
jgi:hypothetical protein